MSALVHVVLETSVFCSLLFVGVAVWVAVQQISFTAEFGDSKGTSGNDMSRASPL